MSSTSLPLFSSPSLSFPPSLTRLLMTWQPRAYRQTISEGLASPTSERRPSSGTNERGNPEGGAGRENGKEREGGREGEREGKRKGKKREREGGTERDREGEGEGERERRGRTEVQRGASIQNNCIDESRCMF